MTYHLPQSPSEGMPAFDGVIRDADMAFIPHDERNKDWQEYQVWLKDGNQPEPWSDPETWPDSPSYKAPEPKK